MANKLPWFTHDHDAHEDISIRSAVRKHGHVAGWVWWCTLELLHKHGIGDTLTMPLVDMAASMMVDKRTCKGVYVTLCELGLVTRASYEQGPCTVCTVVIEKFRARQAKLKFKTPARLPQDSRKTPQEREEERERHTPISPKGDFDRFWEIYPKKIGKETARKIWIKIKPDISLVPKIMAAVVAQKTCEQWVRDNGQYIPHPATWLNNARWDDEVTQSKKDWRLEPAVVLREDNHDNK